MRRAFRLWALRVSLISAGASLALEVIFPQRHHKEIPHGCLEDSSPRIPGAGFFKSNVPIPTWAKCIPRDVAVQLEVAMDRQTNNPKLSEIMELVKSQRRLKPTRSG